jgi:signal-transduction protein with cAMP-binding, CBS, and nucleotidyltransferase domain
MVTVKAILEKKKKAFNTIEPEALVIDALTMLNSVNLSYLVVMEGSEYKGIFCERDYSRNVILKGRSSRDTPVKDVMTINLPIVQMNDTAEHCMMEMNRRKARYLLAYDGPDFKGVITIHDLLRQVLASKEAVFDQAVAQKLLDHDEEGGGKVF